MGNVNVILFVNTISHSINGLNSQLLQVLFKEKDNRSEEEQELIQLRKKVKQLEMENDILKQAALILGRR